MKLIVKYEQINHSVKREQYLLAKRENVNFANHNIALVTSLNESSAQSL